MPATVRVTQFALNTSTGTQDITLSGAGDCNGYILFASPASSNDSETASGGFSIGMCDDGGTTTCRAISGQDAVGTSNTSRITSQSIVLQLYTNAQATDAVAAHDSFITDGIRIDITDAPAAASLVTAWLFYGSDISTVITGGSQTITDDAETLYTVNQQTDVVFCFTNLHGSTDIDTDFSILAFGMACDNVGIPQGGMTMIDFDAQGTTNCSTYCSDNRVMHWMSSSDVIDVAYEVTTLSSTQVGITTREANAQSPTPRVDLMSVSFGGAVQFEIGGFSTPTSTGNSTISGIGFTPAFIGMLLSHNTSYAVEAGSGIADTSYYIGGADGTEETCAGMHSEDGVGTSNTGCYTDTSLVATRDEVGAAQVIGTHSSFGSGTQTTNYTTVDGSARVGVYLAVETEAVAADEVRDPIHARGVIPFERS